MLEKHARDVFLDDLLETLLCPQTKDEMLDFLIDLCTPRELSDLAQRYAVARMLHNGASYASIQEETKASATTIARISRTLAYGTGGYQRQFEYVENAPNKACASDENKGSDPA